MFGLTKQIAWARRVLAASALIAATAACASAQEPLQDEALQEQRARDYVEAFNSGDAAAYEAFMQANRTAALFAAATPEARADGYRELREMFGDFEIYAVDLPRPLVTVLGVSASADGLNYQITMAHEDDDARRLAAITFDAAPADIDAPQDWADLDDLLAQYCQLSGVPAWAAAVVTRDTLVDAAVVGVDEGGRPLDRETLFFWGSVAKSVTGTMLGGLIEEGVLDWDTTIGEVWPDGDIDPGYRGVTLTELMGHRAGAPSFTNFTPELVADWRERYQGDEVERRAAFVADILRQPPEFTPGEDMAYSNAGITIAGAMAEAVTGRSWAELVAAHVYEPLAMGSAGSRRSGFAAESADEAADPEMARMRADFAFIGALIAPAGDTRSTIEDFARYAQMHLRGMSGQDDHLRAETIARLHAAPDDEVSRRREPYSFGWGHRVLEDGSVMHWHNGGAGFSYAEVRLFPDQGLAIVIAANSGGSESYVGPLWRAIYDRYAE